MYETAFGTVKISERLKQNSFYSKKSWKEGEVISGFGAREIMSAPNYLSVQVADDRHILLCPQYLEYINHSCDPNVFFDTHTYEMIALKDIAVGEEMGFFYPSTEWDMIQPFPCLCGAENCLKTIQGAAHLPLDIIKQHRFTEYIIGKLSQRTS